jgi:hypothetical protein
MAISLKRYEPQVSISGEGTAVQVDPRLAIQAAGSDEIQIASIASALGDQAQGYFEKKQKIKDDSDKADYTTRMLKFKNDLESAKANAIQSGVNYKDVYQKVYEPMMVDFENETFNSGYSPEVLNIAQQNFAYDVEQIRGAEFANVETIDLNNFRNKLQKGISDHISIFGFGKNPEQDEVLKQKTDSLGNIVGDDIAKSAVEEALVSSKLAQVEAIANSDIPYTERVEKLEEVKEEIGSLSVAGGVQVNVAIEATTEELAGNVVKQINTAQNDIVDMLVEDKFDYGRYLEIRDQLPEADKDTLDEFIVKKQEPAVASELLVNEKSNADAVVVADLVSRFKTGESVYKRGKLSRLFTRRGGLKGDGKLTYNEVFEIGKDLSPQAQSLLFVMMTEEMEKMTSENRPLDVVEVYGGRAFSPLYGSVGGVETTSITFDDKGGDFLEEMVRAAGNLTPNQNLLVFMNNAMSSYIKFKRAYPEPTVEEYKQFRRETFGTSVRQGIRNILDQSTTEEVPPEQLELITKQK